MGLFLDLINNKFIHVLKHTCAISREKTFTLPWGSLSDEKKLVKKTIGSTRAIKDSPS